MPRKYKVLCPSDAHHGYSKILFAVDLDANTLWLYCSDHKCRTWYKAELSTSGVKLTKMPKDYHFEFERLPILSDEFVQESANG